MASRLLMTCLIMAGFFLGIGFISSLLLALSVLSRIFGIILGIILCLLAVLFIVLIFKKSEDGKLRWQYIFTSVASIAAGIILLATSSNFYVVDSKLNKFSLYVIITVSLTSLLSVALPYITNKVIADEFKSANIDKAQETTLYIISNLLTAFLIAGSFCFTDLESNSKVFSTDFGFSAIAWVVAGIFGAILGYIIDSKTTPLASQYDSNYDTTNSYDSIK